MATTDCTLGCRFAKSKFLAKTYSLKPNELSRSMSGSDSGSLSGPEPPSCLSNCSLDDHFAELMETLRVHIFSEVHGVLRLPLPAQKRSRLVRNYWEVELLVKEMRLMLDPLVLSQLRLGSNPRATVKSP